MAEQDVDFGRFEAGQLDIEVDIDQSLDLFDQEFRVPAGVQGELIVGDHERAFLRFSEALELYDRHGRVAKALRRLKPPVTGNDLVIFVRQDRIGKSELGHARHDLANLPV